MYFLNGEVKETLKANLPTKVLRRGKKKKMDIKRIMNHHLTDPGGIILLVGRSGSGKTLTASLMAWKWAEEGIGVYTNLPIITKHPLIFRVSSLSELTELSSKSPKGRRNIFILDEANMKLSASRSTTTTARAMKDYANNYSRKISNGSIMLIYQSASQPAPIFREGDVLTAVITKLSKNMMEIKFENGVTFTLSNIPLPDKADMVVNSRGPASFVVDFEPEDLDNYIAKYQTKSDPTLEHLRATTLRFLKDLKKKEKEEKKNGGRAKRSGSAQLIELIKEKESKGEKLPDNKELAGMFGLNTDSVASIKSKTKRLIREGKP